MGKDSFRFSYDPTAALRNCPKLLGMELTQRGQQWEGPYYLNGDRHPYRRDKIKAFIWKGSVWVQEEGGRTVSLPTWLVEFGGAADYKEALRMIKDERQSIDWSRDFVRQKPTEVKYVSPDVVQGLKAYPLERCNLFRWTCTMFPEERVREVWDKYNTCTDSHGNAVFFYTDQQGRVLFDKRIAYKEDGKRDRNYFPGRKFKVADGYSGRCYFGSNTLSDEGKVYVCESEKSCLLVALMYGRQCVATGGKGNLRDVDDRMVLLPDMDARMEWENKGPVWEWWEKWGLPLSEIPDHADIGDLIVYKKTGKI